MYEVIWKPRNKSEENEQVSVMGETEILLAEE